MVSPNFRNLQTISLILVETVWMTADQIEALQPIPSKGPLQPVNGWKKCAQIFCVTHRETELFPRYQFDSTFQPLPVVHEILKAFGTDEDAWTIAAWFHFPNAWLLGTDGLPAAPKDALHDTSIVDVAAKRLGTYVA